MTTKTPVRATSAPGTPRSEPPHPQPAAPPSARPITVRRREHLILYTARQLTEPQEISTIHGPQRGQAGDYVVSYDNGIAYQVVSEGEFLRDYQTVGEQQGLTLNPEQITRIAKCVRFGAAASAAELTTAIEAISHVQIGGVDVPFSPAQIAELKLRAQKRGQTPEQYTKMIVDHILDNFFIAKA